MFGMEKAQENIQGSLGNIKKPDFPEQSFYSESLNAEHEVEAKEQGMAPSNGPCPINSQKHLNAVEVATKKKLAEIKEHADENAKGENETGFNAFDELENCLFTVGEHLKNNSRIYTTAGTTVAGAGIGAALAHRAAKKAGIKKGTSEYKKLMAKKAVLGAATGLVAGEGANILSHGAKIYKAEKRMGKGALGRTAKRIWALKKYILKSKNL